MSFLNYPSLLLVLVLVLVMLVEHLRVGHVRRRVEVCPLETDLIAGLDAERDFTGRAHRRLLVVHVGVGRAVHELELGTERVVGAAAEQTEVAARGGARLQRALVREGRVGGPADEEVVRFVLALGRGDALLVGCVGGVVDGDGHADHVLHLEEDGAHGILEDLVEDDAVAHGQVVRCAVTRKKRRSRI